MRILFADPDRELTEVYRRLYALTGDEVIAVHDGIQAMEALKKETFDAAVVRDELPRYDSGLVRKTLKNLHVPCIVLSETEDGTDGGEVLSFPFLPETLEKRLKEVTGNE